MDIATLREKVGATQAEFAEWLETTPAVVASWEKRRREPKKETAYKIIDLARDYGLRMSLEDVYPRD